MVSFPKDAILLSAPSPPLLSSCHTRFWGTNDSQEFNVIPPSLNNMVENQMIKSRGPWDTGDRRNTNHGTQLALIWSSFCHTLHEHCPGNNLLPIKMSRDTLCLPCWPLLDFSPLQGQRTYQPSKQHKELDTKFLKVLVRHLTSGKAIQWWD